MAIKDVVVRGFVFSTTDLPVRGFSVGAVAEDTTPVYRYRDASSTTFRSKEPGSATFRSREISTGGFRPK